MVSYRILALFALLLGLPAVSMYSNPLYFFECTTSGELLPIQWKCNGQPDCTDGSDELNCACEYWQFQCGSGECLHSSYRCDLQVDCQDGSDEVDCRYSFRADLATCTQYERACDSGICIREAFWCDGEFDCADKSDEKNCTLEGCKENQFQCKSGECIPSNWECDSESDCTDSTDELHCTETNFECGFGFFNCTNFGCINVNLVCDGTSDCPDDNSDEEDCPDGGGVCYDHEFRCADIEAGCITQEWVCDGYDDCGDYSDETGCDGVCALDHEFECTTGGCANITSKCDGVLDCRDGSDEFVCPYPPPRLECQESQYSCLDGQGCIAITQVCDGVEHCMDGSDELENVCTQSLNRSCDTDNGGCSHNCHPVSSRRAICTCRHGYQLGVNLTSCHDIDECQYPFRCSQYCHNTPGGFNCSCAEGYVPHPTKGCKATGPSPTLLLANREDIRSYSLGPHASSSILIRDLHNCIALDYHYQHQYLYWSDASQAVIKRSTLDGSHITTIVRQDLDTPGGLAVDWVSDKLYWTDSGNSRIEVSDIDGKNRTVLFSTGLGEPRAIVVDPEVGYLFWTDWGTEPKIERASMDGKNRTVLHSVHIFWPNALTTDFVTKSIYWADAKLRVIESSFYDGSQRRPVLTEGVRHVFAMSLFEDTVYWTEWETRSIFSTNKGVGRHVSRVTNGSTTAGGVMEVDTDLFRPMDIHVVHPLRQRSSANPCAVDNGGCEFMCLLSALSPEGYSCTCPTGIEVADDGRSCKPLHSFLLFAHRTDIRRVSLDTDVPVDVILPLVNMTGSMALDWDHQTNQLFWTDIFQDSISVSRLDGTNQRILLVNNMQTPAGLAVDWLARKLYWTDDADVDRIEVSEFDGSNRAIVVHGNMDKPRDIVVHPTAGFMFWTDWGNYPRIERANLDGSERVAIVSNDLFFPNGLAIDYELEKLYWCDGSGYIECCDFDGSNRRSIINATHLHLFGLALHEEWLYFTDWETHSVFRADKLTGGQLEAIIRGLDKPMDVHLFHKNRTTSEHHPCLENNGNCSHLCLSRPSGAGGLEASCHCPTGYVLQADNKTCNSYIDNYLLFPTDSQLRQVSLDTDYLANVVLPVSGVRAVISSDVDIVTDDFYWADTLESKIFRLPSGGEPEVFVSSGILKPESLAVDWIGRNLYWGDSELGRIEVVHLVKKVRSILVSRNLHHVNALAIDLKSHLMFWIDAGDVIRGVSPKIERATMDGTGRHTIVSINLQQPRAITIDNSFGLGARIYWTDSGKGTIESASFDGRSRKAVIAFPPESSSSPFGITLSGDYVYWTDMTSNSVNRALKTDGSQQLRIVSDLPAVSGITVVTKADLDRKASFDHGCDEEQQHCSDICLPNVATSIFTCACPTGIRLQDDHMTCKDSPDEFVLMPARTSIRRISLDMEEDFNDVTILDGLNNVLVLDYVLTGPRDGIIVFGDSKLNTIYTSSLDGSGKRAIIHDVAGTQGLAVDWVSLNLYWTESDSKTVQVASLNGRHRKVLFRERVDKPRAIALHPAKGLMFWTDWGEEPVIEIAQMDGSNRQIIVSSRIEWPNGLSIDREASRIYWVDGKHESVTLDSCNYNGGSRRTIVRGSSDNLEFPFGIVFFKGFVFWTDWILKGLYRARVSDNPDTSNELLIQQFAGARPFQPIVVSLKHLREGELNRSGPCVRSNGGCPYLCLPHDETLRTCACPNNTDTCTEMTGLPTVPMDTDQATPSTPPPGDHSDRPTKERDTDPTPPDPTSPNVGQNFPDISTRNKKPTTPTTSEPTKAAGVTGTLTIGMWLMLTFGLLIVALLIGIIVGGLVIAKWLHDKSKVAVAVTTGRMEATNPHYCTSKFGGSGPPKLGGESNSIKTSSPEKVIGNLLPKRHNNDPHRCPPSPTSANLFVEKKDHYIVPEPPRRKRPKPPRALPKSTPLNLEESPSPPLPPKHPKKIPPCSSAPIPKQVNLMKAKERSKTVRFDPSVPPEEEPPPLPKRGIPAGSPSEPALLPKVVNTGISNRGVSWTDSDTSEITVSSEGDGKRPLIHSSSAPPPARTPSASLAKSVNLEDSESAC